MFAVKRTHKEQRLLRKQFDEMPVGQTWRSRTGDYTRVS